MISKNDAPEFTGQIIDIFEDFLAFKGISIDNEEKADDPDAAILYGMDYYWILDRLEELLINWKTIEPQ